MLLAPGPPASLDLESPGETEMTLHWTPPGQPNGVLKGYLLQYQQSGSHYICLYPLPRLYINTYIFFHCASLACTIQKCYWKNVNTYNNVSTTCQSYLETSIMEMANDDNTSMICHSSLRLCQKHSSNLIDRFSSLLCGPQLWRMRTAPCRWRP